MIDPFDDLLFAADWPPERVHALRAACDADPELAQALAGWQRLREHVRARLVADVPERSLLVLYALDVAGRSDVLNEAERAALSEARGAIRRALQVHPALEDVVKMIQDEADAFDRLWEVHVAAGPRVRPDRPPHRPRRGVARWMGRGAVALAVVAFAAIAFLLVQRDRSLVTVETGPDEVRRLSLADGSVVRLMEASALTFPDPARDVAFDRRVRLRGDAFFEIVADREGFVVETATARVTVLGTRFGLQARDDVTEVVLATGRLALSPAAAPGEVVVLEPGQMSRVAARALPSTPVAVDVSEALAWTGLFVFEKARAADIAVRLAAHHGVTVTVDPALADEPVTGTFARDQGLEEILSTLGTTLGARLQRLAGGGYHVAADG